VLCCAVLCCAVLCCAVCCCAVLVMLHAVWWIRSTSNLSTRPSQPAPPHARTPPQICYPEPHLTLLTAETGKLRHDALRVASVPADVTCDARWFSLAEPPSRRLHARWRLPCGLSAGATVALVVTCARGATSSFRQAAGRLRVVSAAGSGGGGGESSCPTDLCGISGDDEGDESGDVTGAAAGETLDGGEQSAEPPSTDPAWPSSPPPPQPRRSR